MHAINVLCLGVGYLVVGLILALIAAIVGKIAWLWIRDWLPTRKEATEPRTSAFDPNCDGCALEAGAVVFLPAGRCERHQTAMAGMVGDPLFGIGMVFNQPRSSTEDASNDR